MKPSKAIRRALLDLDGTLFDTQIFHARAEVALMAEHGFTTTAEDISAQFAGRPTHLVFKEVLGCDDKLALELTKRKWDQIFPTAAEAKPLCDLQTLFYGLAGRGVAISIGTASPVRWAIDLLRLNGLGKFVTADSVIGGDMVANGKPAPDIWQLAACDTPIDQCLVVEDGTAGIEAAQALGMPCALLLPKEREGAIKIASALDILSLV